MTESRHVYNLVQAIYPFFRPNLHARASRLGLKPKLKVLSENAAMRCLMARILKNEITGRLAVSPPLLEFSGAP